MKRRGKAALCLGMTGVMAVGTMLSGCGKEQTNGKVKIEVVQYKPEAVDVFEELEKKFNETHDNIELVIDSPNDAMTILKTRFIREDYPDMDNENWLKWIIVQNKEGEMTFHTERVPVEEYDVQPPKY